MKYIIMADGKGTRWGNYNDVPKHLAKVDGEPIIARTVRLLESIVDGDEIIITSHNKDYNFPPAIRYEPKNNVLEIDRFTEELVEDNICFLYGDTYYTEEAIKHIVHSLPEDLLFFGNEKSIVAVKVKNSKAFKKHYCTVKRLFLEGKIDRCVGWQLYQSFTGLPFTEKKIDKKFIYLDNNTTDFNMPEEYKTFTKK